MRIMFFIPSLEGGGAERVALNLAKEAHARRIETYVVVSKARGKLYEDMNKVASIVDLNKARVNKCVKPLAKVIDDIQPNVVISFMDHCNVVLLLAKLFTNFKNFKSIISVHNNLEVNLTKTSKWKGEVMKVLVRLLYNRADSIVCVSNGVKFSLSKFLPTKTLNKACVIYNPSLDRSITVKATESTELPFNLGTSKLICAVGRLTKQKGFDLLIDSYAKLNTRLADTKLIILGEGEERDNLTRQIKHLGLENKIFLLGFQNNPYKYISKSNLFVFSSRWEGFGVALVEALYLQTNVVSFDCDYGPREILSDGLYGRLVQVGDTDAFSIAMEESLIENNVGIDMLEYLSRFTVEDVFSEYEKLWK